MFFAHFASAAAHDDLTPSRVAAVCVSDNHEDADIATVRQGAERFGIAVLSDYALLMQERRLDKGNTLLRQATQALADFATQHYGKVSREAVMCRRAYMQAIADTEKALALQLATLNADHAQQLSRQAPTDTDLKVLSLTTRMERLFLESQRDVENPTHWDEVFSIEKAMEPIAKSNAQRTAEWIDLCQYMSVWKAGQVPPDLIEYVDYAFTKTFPDGVYMEGLLFNGYVNNSEAWARQAYNDAKALWGDSDIRTLRCELQLLTVQMQLPGTDYEQQHSRLEQMHAWLAEYMPAGSLFPVEVELQKWDYDVYYGKNLYELSRVYLLLMKVEHFYGEKNISYLGYLHRTLGQQMQTDGGGKAEQLLREEEQLLDTVLADNADLYWTYQAGTAYVRFALASDSPASFQDFLTRLRDYYTANRRPTWISVYLGRNLCELYRSMQRPDDVVDIYKLVMDDVGKLTTRNTVLKSFFDASYVGYLSESDNKENLQLADRLCDKVIASFAAIHHSIASLLYTKATIAFAQDDADGGMRRLREGIASCTQSEDAFYRCMMQMELGARLLSQSGGFEANDEVTALFSEAIPFFEANREQADGTYLNCYQFLADYYTACRQYDKAEETFLAGLSHIEALSLQFSFQWQNIVNGLFGLYAYQMNDLDKADELIEQCIKSTKDNYNLNAHIFLIDLLFSRFDLLASRHADTSLQFMALNDCLMQFQAAKNMCEGDTATLQNLALRLVYSIGGFLPDFAQAIKECEESLHSHDDAIRTMAQKVMPQLNNFKEMLKTEFLDIVLQQLDAQTANSRQPIDNAYRFLADYYLYLCADTIQAEHYYRLLSNTGTGSYYATGMLAAIERDRGHYAKAAEMMEECVNDDKYQFFMSLQNKAADAYAIFYNYYNSRQYDHALKYARHFADYKRQMAMLNFDRLTQAEREAFVSQGGAGGAALYMLLPHFGGQIAPDALDAILAEKGLLLRASERINNAIAQLDDPELQAQQDSLRRLQAYYKTLNTADYVFADIKDNEMTKCRQQIESLERIINRKAAQKIEGMDTPTWQDLQQVLKPGEAAVEYVFSDSVIGALLLRPAAAPLYVALTSGNDLWQDMQDVATPDLKAHTEKLYQADALHLFDRLWKPLEPLLGDVHTVYFSPTGYLNDLAFAAFKTTDGTYLCDRYELHQMLSTGDLVALRRHPSSQSPRTALLYGAVSYDAANSQQSAANSQLPTANSHRGAIVDDDYFAYLPFTADEVKSVQHIMDSRHMDVRLLTGEASTEQSLHDVSGSSPDVLHLSTHGFFVSSSDAVHSNKYLARFPALRFSSMQRCGLALAGANDTWAGATDRPEAADGILTANEVAQMNLGGTRLAVLSACRTAVGHYTIEGVYGMHRGFKQAGVTSILATLWNVNDKSTARLMSLFYSLWLTGKPMQQALGDALRQLRQEYPSPYYWAPFVLMDAED